jgi:hypothetical protein
MVKVSPIIRKPPKNENRLTAAGSSGTVYAHTTLQVRGCQFASSSKNAGRQGVATAAATSASSADSD